MNAADHNPNACSTVRASLVLIACGDESFVTAPPALKLHLATCAVCRAMLADTQNLVQDLRPLLTPQPLTRELDRAIRARLRQVVVPVAARRRSVWGMVGAAAAAVALLAFYAPFRAVEPSSRTVRTVVSAETVAESIATLREQIREVRAFVELNRAADSVLPWSDDDDWDVPGASTEPS
ncbi:MAG: hypothetical protein AB7Q17_02540 [Phycisphaerae bacterium]